MKEVLENVLNAGIALFRTSEDSIGNALQGVQKSYEELKNKGAADKSEAAAKLRSTLQDVIEKGNELGNKAGSTYKEGLTQIEDSYNTVIEQIKKIIPEDKVGEIKTKTEELRKAIKEKLAK